MILGTPGPAPAPGITLDALLHLAARAHGDRLALVEPPDRPARLGGDARALTFADVDDAASRLALRLRDLGLQTDAVIGVQMPRAREAVLGLLGIMRAGMIPALLPPLWRRADIVAALAPLGVKALLCMATRDTERAADTMLDAAAALFGVRYVLGFGAGLPDGVTTLDDALDDEGDVPALDWRPRDGDAARHIAAVTFDTTAEGLVAMARDHAQLLAGAQACGDAPDGEVLLSTLPPATFAGLSLTLARWLRARGTLVLHNPFAPRVLDAQLRLHECTAAILPGPAVARIAEAGLLDNGTLRQVLALWRSPEHVTRSARWRQPRIAMTDIHAFGEVGHVAVPRTPDGFAGMLTLGASPAGAAVPVIDVWQTQDETVALGGAMVPRHAFPPALADQDGQPALRAGADGFVDTGHPCRLDPERLGLSVVGPPAGLVTIGGSRFRRTDIDAALELHAPHARLSVTADILVGQKLRGRAPDGGDAARVALREAGAHALLSEAFPASGEITPSR